MGDVATILASTGMRVGELLALRWNEVDLERGEIHVAFSVTDGGPGIGILCKPTKRSDWRDVPLTASALAALERRAQRFRSKLGQIPGPGAFVFGGLLDGSVPMRPDVVSHRWIQVRGSSAITLLGLRHYVATAMLDAGASYRDGHPRQQRDNPHAPEPQGVGSSAPIGFTSWKWRPR